MSISKKKTLQFIAKKSFYADMKCYFVGFEEGILHKTAMETLLQLTWYINQ